MVGMAAELGFWVFLLMWVGVEASCRSGCELALGSYYIGENENLTYISNLFQETIPEILQSNPIITNPNLIIAGDRLNIPFTCDCINGDFLGHAFSYQSKSGDTYLKLATAVYKNLITVDWLQAVNTYNANDIPLNALVNVTVNCSCGDPAISTDYGLFLIYPLWTGENLSTVADQFNISSALLQQYREAFNSSLGDDRLFVPVQDQHGSYRPLKSSSSGIGVGAIVGIVIGVAAALFLVACLYVRTSRRKKMLLLSTFEDNSTQPVPGNLSGSDKISESVTLSGGSPGLNITVDKSVEFSYEELSKATNDFCLANKIGEGGFGAVYYAELRGEKAAIKKMDMQATKEFLAELKILTRVHHSNLVRLIGYCTEGSLFLVYEFIENGNLSQHLRGSERQPLPWSVRVQIALDSARGLEYIHEHTVPVYIHRDIKSANILIDKNFRGKVADFGLTKLAEVGSASLPTRLVGTFGYMPPESTGQEKRGVFTGSAKRSQECRGRSSKRFLAPFLQFQQVLDKTTHTKRVPGYDLRPRRYAQYGDASPKIDVYAFGVVLYELISAMEAVVKVEGSVTESTGLVALFENVLSQPDPREGLPKIVDPRLRNNYPPDSLYKMAQLARACTQEKPQLRPTMRSMVVALMTLSSSTEDWDVEAFYENQAFVNLMSGR